MKIIRSGMVMGAGLLLAAVLSGAAGATAGHAEPWQVNLQTQVTPVGEYIQWFINWLHIGMTIITLFVLALLVYVMVKFNAKSNPVPSKTTHHVGLEVAWTVIPVLILVAIAIPSFRLLYLERNIPVADVTIKAIGLPSWQWTYELPDLGVDEEGQAKVSFTASLLPEDKAKAEARPYLLATDAPVVVPVNKTVKMIITSDPVGIIHAWTIPSFGMKIDAIPGRLNEDWFKAKREGVFYGECSELCGKEHAFMPIEVWVVAEDKYKAWGEMLKSDPKPDQLLEFMKTIKPAAPAVAAN